MVTTLVAKKCTFRSLLTPLKLPCPLRLQLITEDLGMKLDKVEPSMLGRAKKVRASLLLLRACRKETLDLCVSSFESEFGWLFLSQHIERIGGVKDVMQQSLKCGSRARIHTSCGARHLTCCATLCQVTISKDDTILLDGGGDKEAIEARCDQIRDAADNATSDYDRCDSRILHIQFVHPLSSVRHAATRSWTPPTPSTLAGELWMLSTSNVWPLRTVIQSCVINYSFAFG